MGLDFIRDKAGRPWRKKFAGGVERIKLPGLFDLPFEKMRRTVTVIFTSVGRAGTGEKLIAHANGAQLDVCRGATVIGMVQNPPEDVMNAIRSAGGDATASVVDVSPFGTAAEVELQ